MACHLKSNPTDAYHVSMILMSIKTMNNFPWCWKARFHACNYVRSLLLVFNVSPYTRLRCAWFCFDCIISSLLPRAVHVFIYSGIVSLTMGLSYEYGCLNIHEVRIWGKVVGYQLSKQSKAREDMNRVHVRRDVYDRQTKPIKCLATNIVAILWL